MRGISPKAHGAWLGGGTGTLIGSVVIGLIQSYVTHKALPLSMQTLIEGVTSSVVAFLGAYVMPLINSGGTTTPTPEPVPGPVVSPAPVTPASPANDPVNTWGVS